MVAGWQELALIAGVMEIPGADWQIIPGSQAATPAASGRQGPPSAPMSPQRAAPPPGPGAQPEPGSQICELQAVPTGKGAVQWAAVVSHTRPGAQPSPHGGGAAPTRTQMGPRSPPLKVQNAPF